MSVKNVWRVCITLVLIAGMATSAKPAHALGTPQILSVSPSSGPAGTTFTVHAAVTWDDDFRAIRICFRDASYCHESGAPDITNNFNTDGLAPGIYYVIAQVAGKGDNDWANPTWTSETFEVTGQAEQEPEPQSQPQPQPQEEPHVPSFESTLCKVNSFEISPNPAFVGDTLVISASGSCTGGVRAIKVRLDGTDLYEFGGPSFEWDWNTAGLAPGDHYLVVWVVARGDNDWRQKAWSYTLIITLKARNGGTGEQYRPNDGTGSGYCVIENMTVSPDSPQFFGTNISIGITGNCYGYQMHLRVLIDGSESDQSTSSPFKVNWNGGSVGTHTIRVEIKQAGEKWANAAYKEQPFTIQPAPPIQPTVQTVPPIILQQDGPDLGQEGPSGNQSTESSWWCQNIGWGCNNDLSASEAPYIRLNKRGPVDNNDPGFVQCAEYAAQKRPDSLCWLPTPADGGLWVASLDNTEKSALGITVDKHPDKGDVVEFINCPKGYPSNHVALVSSASPNGFRFGVFDANRKYDGVVREDDFQYTVNTSCMNFISPPTKTYTTDNNFCFVYQQSGQPNVNKNTLDQIIDWWNNLWN